MTRYTVRVTLVEFGGTSANTRQVASEELPPMADVNDAMHVFNRTVNASVMAHAHVIREGR